MKPFSDYLAKPMACACGKTHSVATKTIDTNTTAPQIAARCEELFGGKTALLLCDENTHAAFGGALEQALTQTGWTLEIRTFPGGPPALASDEAVLGSAVFGAGPKVKGVIAVGGGTLTDLGRFVASRLGKPVALVMTCASMDGYASNVAGMMVGGKKVIYKDCRYPDAIFASREVMAAAPYELTKSGFGDMLGKYTALPDWVLAHHMQGEAFCEETAGLMLEAADACMDAAAGIAGQQPAAVAALTDALVCAGLCMALAADTRPASGSEHLFSHYLVDAAIREGKAPPAHGVTVGFGTLVATLLYEYLLENAAPAEILAIAPQLKTYLRPSAQIRAALAQTHIGAKPEDYLPGQNALAEMINACSAPGKKYSILRYLKDNALLDDGIRYVQAHI